MFRCIDLDLISQGQLGLLLDADLKHTCYEGMHQEYIPLAFVSIVVFLIGIPLMTFFMLFRNRHRLNDSDVKAQLGDLFMKYENRWYFWESVLMLQKCLLTGAMCAIAPGSPIQLVVALLVCAAYLLVREYFLVVFSTIVLSVVLTLLIFVVVVVVVVVVACVACKSIQGKFRRSSCISYFALLDTKFVVGFMFNDG
jgi:hypothetical protein